MTKFLAAYIACALWSSNDESTPSGGEPLDENYSSDDLAPETLSAMAADCEKFQAENEEALANAGDDGQNGHDFWLTRNRHGAGFWDRGYGEIGEKLSEAARAYGECNLYVGDDGLIRLM